MQIFAGKEEFHHKDSIPDAIVKELRPIYKYLGGRSLLEKCKDGYTQNANESIHVKAKRRRKGLNKALMKKEGVMYAPGAFGADQPGPSGCGGSDAIISSWAGWEGEEVPH